MLSDRCLSACLTVCDVSGPGQTVGWIRMPLGMVVGLGPGHILLDGTQLPKGAQSPNFRRMPVVAIRLDNQNATW